MNTFEVFLTIAAWAIIVLNLLAWAVTIYVKLTHPRGWLMTMKPNWADGLMVLAFCWLLSTWVTG